MQVCLTFAFPCGFSSRSHLRALKSLRNDSLNSNPALKRSTANLKTALLNQSSIPQFGEFDSSTKKTEYQSDHVLETQEDELYSERVLLVGIGFKRTASREQYSMEDSLNELASLAETAGLQVISRTHQSVDRISPATYIGAGKVQELVEMVRELDVSSVIFDGELSPVQLLNLEKTLSPGVRICDRTALILDIFSQQAQSKEGKLQVELAQCKYQFPRLTQMWTHLERQAGGARAVKGMGEKQIEIDKRILQKRMISLSRELEEVRLHRRLARIRRAENCVPVVTLVGYTNAGKSTLMNELTEADVLVANKLFATLDPTTRKLKLPTGKIALLSDTVGFIQKLPHQLLAAFGATLEELRDSNLLLHVMDISSVHVLHQEECVKSVLTELGVREIPVISVWNKIDQVSNEVKERILIEASNRPKTYCVSSKTGEGFVELLEGIEKAMEESMVPVLLLVPYSQGEFVELVYSQGVVKKCSHLEQGTLLEASVPVYLAKQMQEFQTEALQLQSETEFG
eukprot:g7608.t1